MRKFEHLHHLLCQRSLVAQRRYIFFQTVEPDAVLPYLEEADRLYCKFRKNAAAPDFQKASNASSFLSKSEIVQRLHHDHVFTQALCVNLLTYLITLEFPTNHPKRPAETVQRRLANLSLWVQRSKARSLLDG